jgi:hypothetical protein
MLLVSLGLAHWPRLEELNRYLARTLQVPGVVWGALIFLLLIVAAAHAKARLRREQESLSEEHGWQFSKDWSPIDDADWQQLSKHTGLASLSSAVNRSNFTWGIHEGIAFVLFEAPGRMVRPNVRTAESMIAFSRPKQPSSKPSLTFGEESGAWEMFLTDKWIFLRTKTPRWVMRGEQAVRFVQEAYQQLEIAHSLC